MELAEGPGLAFEVSGAHAGTPVLLLRPPGGSLAMWGTFRATLASRLRVIAFERGGAGEPSGPPRFVSTRGMGQEALVVLDRLGVARAHVFGVSLGGMAATWLAIDAPERVARVCLASTPDTGLELSWPVLAGAGAFAACLLGPETAVEAKLARRLLSRAFRAEEPERAARIVALAGLDRRRRGQIVRHVAAAVLHDARFDLHNVRAPVLVLAGDRDELIGSAPQQALARSIRGATFETVRGAGHDITLESPRAVAERVLHFFFDEAVDTVRERCR